MVATIQKLDHSKYRHFCLDFECVLTKWGQFVQISNGFRISDPIQNLDQCNPTSFRPFGVQTSPDFRSLLLSKLFFFSGLQWGQEAIEAKAPYIHGIVWTLATCQTAAVLILKKIEGKCNLNSGHV